jgi:hypothetical protein
LYRPSRSAEGVPSRLDDHATDERARSLAFSVGLGVVARLAGPAACFVARSIPIYNNWAMHQKLLRDLQVGDAVYFEDSATFRILVGKETLEILRLSDRQIGLKPAAAIRLTFADGVSVDGHPSVIVDVAAAAKT